MFYFSLYSKLGGEGWEPANYALELEEGNDASLHHEISCQQARIFLLLVALASQHQPSLDSSVANQD